MKLILILSLILFLTCKNKEEPASVVPTKQGQEDTVYYPAKLKPFSRREISS
ncbi:MAG: hypothetical protein IPL26_21230 [Leptospiraceae bacterium]|nr:hypothetical protein [Leptospiraceae bacterium]